MIFKRSHILTSLPFLIGLSLLLANDFYFKPVFHNEVTGKLSDFSGLFVFALFWIALFPQFAGRLFLIIGIAFVFWKSAYSQPVLDAWNALGMLNLDKTVDFSDLAALSVLPFAYHYANRAIPMQFPRRWAVCSIALISVFAFTATSYRTSYDDYHKNYFFPGPKANFFQKIDDLHLTYYDFPLREEVKSSDKLELWIPAAMCFGKITALIEVTEADGQTVVNLKKLTHDCPEHDGDRDKLLSEFEKEFIERIRTNTPQTKHYKDKT